MTVTRRIEQREAGCAPRDFGESRKALAVPMTLNPATPRCLHQANDIRLARNFRFLPMGCSPAPALTSRCEQRNFRIGASNTPQTAALPTVGAFSCPDFESGVRRIEYPKGEEARSFAAVRSSRHQGRALVSPHDGSTPGVFQMLEAILMQADEKTRLALGNYLIRVGRKVVADIEAEAELNAELARRRFHIDRIRSLLPLVTRLIFHGNAKVDALDRVSQRFGIDAPQLGAWWKMREGPRAVTAMRNKRIVKLAAQGWASERLAEKFGIAHQTAYVVVRKAVMRGQLVESAAVRSTRQ